MPLIATTTDYYKLHSHALAHHRLKENLQNLQLQTNEKCEQNNTRLTLYYSNKYHFICIEKSHYLYSCEDPILKYKLHNKLSNLYINFLKKIVIL